MISLAPRFLEQPVQAALRAQYLGAKPFQHLVLDGVLEPALVHEVAAEFPAARHNVRFMDEKSRLKFTCDDWNAFPPRTAELS